MLLTMTCFNSMKVRLKPVDPRLLTGDLFAFQFHEGPIKTKPFLCFGGY